MTEGAKKMYCPSCGETVETFVMFNPDMAEEFHCFVCGAALSGETPGAVKPLEMMLVETDRDLRAGNYSEAERLLVSVNGQLDEIAQGVLISHPP